MNIDILLDAALNLIVTEGYHRLTIERLAQRMGYSRTTLYKQVESSEELLGKVALRTAERLDYLLERIPRKQQGSRAELWALVVAYEVYARCNSEDFALHVMLGLPGLRTVLADKDLEALNALRQKGLDRLTKVFERAVKSGEIDCDASSSGELLAGLYAATTGFLNQVALGHASIHYFKLENPWRSALRSVNTYLNGLDWRPESHEFDYVQLRWQILVECFPEKLRELGENQVP
ncbi:MAG: TetR/AcrR family transcriptional regulator [Opitutales bacterium]|nr:TetR/AcrR family transcriptional regulator [Opitutales bacterium]